MIPHPDTDKGNVGHDQCALHREEEAVSQREAPLGLDLTATSPYAQHVAAIQT